MRSQTTAVEREQINQIADARPLLEGERPVHVRFAGVELGIEGEPGMERPVMKAQRHAGPGAFAAKEVNAAAGIDKPQRPFLNKLGQQTREQSHRRRFPFEPRF